MNECVMCGADLPTEYDSMVCKKCLHDVLTPNMAVGTFEIPKNNVELSFNGGSLETDFIVGYRRKKPLNRFQIWMFKICFGICAKNI